MQVDEGIFDGLAWRGRAIDVDEIEHELRRLWQARTAREGEASALRSSVMNLVIYTSSDADARTLFAAIGKLSGRHPARALVLSMEPGQPADSLDVALGLRCVDDPSSGQEVCSEQVLLEANGVPANHPGTLVAPLLLPDLPVCLWWMGEPAYGTKGYADLMRVATKLIIDTGSFAATADSLRRALETSRSDRRVCAVADLNWVRLWRWFEAIAQFFDDPALQPHLDGIRRLRAAYAAAPGTPADPAQAALLAGWLFSRLREAPTGVELEPVRMSRPDVAPGNVVAWEMETRDGADAARFEVRLGEAEGASAIARAVVNDQVFVEREVNVEARTDVEALNILLEGCERDKPYEESVALAAELLEGGNRQ